MKRERVARRWQGPTLDERYAAWERRMADMRVRLAREAGQTLADFAAAEARAAAAATSWWAQPTLTFTNGRTVGSPTRTASPLPAPDPNGLDDWGWLPPKGRARARKRREVWRR